MTGARPGRPQETPLPGWQPIGWIAAGAGMTGVAGAMNRVPTVGAVFLTVAAVCLYTRLYGTAGVLPVFCAPERQGVQRQEVL